MSDREEQAVESSRKAARQTDQLGPGTAGYTISGAASRGMEVAADRGVPSPADPGFPVTEVGLHPGQGVDAQGTNVQEAEDLASQKINLGARPAGRGPGKGERP